MERPPSPMRGGPGKGQQLGCSEYLCRAHPSTSLRPSARTHRSAGDPSRPAAPPAARSAPRPAARFPASWPDSGAPSDTRALRRWSELAGGGVRDHCNRGSSISWGPTDRTGGGGRARRQLVAPPPTGTSLRGGQPRWPARPRQPPPARMAPDTRPARGERVAEGGQLPAPLRASLGDPAFARDAGRRNTAVGPLCNLMTSTLCLKLAPHLTPLRRTLAKFASCAGAAGGRGEAWIPTWGSAGRSPGTKGDI